MGIYVDYVLCAECDEETLRDRLERVRQRCLDLPLKAVGEVRRVEAIHNPVTFMLLRSQGHTLPAAIAERLRQVEEDPDHGDLCIAFAPMLNPELPRHQRERYYRPALQFIEGTDLWRQADLPEAVKEEVAGFTVLEIHRRGLEFDFASLMLRYGYLLIIQPGEGCESVCLGLSTFAQPEGSGRSRKPPLWYGQGFTKTQYAKEFILVHETVCRVLDIAQEEALLLKGSDNCGYYTSRSWKEASKRVNEELRFARMVGGMMGMAIGNLREEGVPVQVVQDNASTAKPVDFSSALAREQEAEPESSETRPAEDKE